MFDKEVCVLVRKVLFTDRLSVQLEEDWIIIRNGSRSVFLWEWNTSSPRHPEYRLTRFPYLVSLDIVVTKFTVLERQ